MAEESTSRPMRKKMRLSGYDYSSSGAYFVTICILDRYPLLWDSVGANCVRPGYSLSHTGHVVDTEIQKLSAVYECVSVDKYCIMPDHIHMMIRIASDGSGRTQFAPTLSRIIKQFKGTVTKQIGFSMWQKSFYDTIIRSEEKYHDIWHYIDQNPLTWALKEHESR